MKQIKKTNKDLLKREANLIKSLESILPKKSMGGQLISSALSLVPGYGQILSPLASMADNYFSNKKTEEVEIPENIMTNPYGNLKYGGKMAFGGVINNDFKQYNTGSHNSNADLPVDKNGNASLNTATAKVQNKENSFKIGLDQYVMSDVLINPETGNAFNKDAAKINKKYPQATYQEDQKNALNFKMKRLASLNDSVRKAAEQIQTVEKFFGGPTDPTKRYPIGVDGKSIIPDNSQIYPEANNSNALVPAAYTPFGNIETNLPLNTTNIYPGSPITLGENLNEETPSITSDRSETTFKPRSAPRALDARDSNNIALALKGAGLLKSVADAFTPAEKEKTILPDYSKSDNYMASANIDYSQAKQDAMGISNIAANVNRSAGSNNFAAFQGREAARIANLMDSVGNINMQENNQRSNLNLTRGQYEQSKALDTANRETQNRINNQQNQANANFADEKLFSELTSIGTEFNQYSNHLRELKNNKEIATYYINEGLAMINSNLSNFNLDPQFVEKLKSGASMDELVKFYPDQVVKLKTSVDVKNKKNGNN
jgi:hypothetical protein